MITNAKHSHKNNKNSQNIKNNNENVIIVYEGHTQEVCGLKWSFDGSQLASGGNDNHLMIWTLHSTKPIMCNNSHLAAVKAIAWSPHQHNILASGGGTADRTIRFWNTSTFENVLKYEKIVTKNDNGTEKGESGKILENYISSNEQLINELKTKFIYG